MNLGLTRSMILICDLKLGKKPLKQWRLVMDTDPLALPPTLEQYLQSSEISCTKVLESRLQCNKECRSHLALHQLSDKRTKLNQLFAISDNNETSMFSAAASIRISVIPSIRFSDPHFYDQQHRMGKIKKMSRKCTICGTQEMSRGQQSQKKNVNLLNVLSNHSY